MNKGKILAWGIIILLGLSISGVYGAYILKNNGDSYFDSATTYIDSTPFDTYVTALAGGISVITQASPYTYIVSVSGGTYYANSTTGGTNYSNATFSTVMNNMLAAVGDGESVYIKPGAYTLTAQITASLSNFEFIVDKGATITASGGITGAMLRWIGATGAGNHETNIRVSGGTWDCNSKVVGIIFKWCDHVEVDHCYILNGRGGALRDGIECYSEASNHSLDFNAHDNYLYNFEGAGISVSYTSGFNIYHNRMKDCAQTYPGGGGVDCDAGVEDGEVNDNVIWSTSAVGTRNDGIYIGTSSDPAERIIIANNNIDIYCLNASGYSADSWVSGIKNYGTMCLISGNVIRIASDLNGACGIAEYGDQNSVVGNTLIGVGGSGKTPRCGIIVGTAGSTDHKNNVANNRVIDTWLYGVLIESDYNYLSDNDLSYLTTGLRVTGANNNLTGGNFKGCTTTITDSGASNIAYNYFDKNGAWITQTVIDATSVEADSYTVNSVPLNNYIISVVPGTATGFQPYTYTFIKDGADHLAINGATGAIDYNSTSAYTTIQSAIDASTGVYGSQAPVSYLVGPGTWTLTTGISLPTNCVFQGSGAEVTWLVKSGAGTYVVGPKYANYTYNVRIANMRIDAASAATYAIQWSNTAVTLPGGQTYYGWLNLENVHVRGASTSIYIKSTSGIHMICFWSGVRAASTKIYIERASDSIFQDVYCGSAEVKACASCLFQGWYVGGAAAPNFLLHGGSAAYPCEKNSFVNMHFDNPSGHNVEVGDYASYNLFSGCKFTNHNSGGSDNTYSALHMIEQATNNTITGCTFSQDATPPGNQFKYWVEEINSADYNNYVGCIFGSAGADTAALSHAANSEHTGCIGD